MNNAKDWSAFLARVLQELQKCHGIAKKKNRVIHFPISIAVDYEGVGYEVVISISEEVMGVSWTCDDLHWWAAKIGEDESLEYERKVEMDTVLMVSMDAANDNKVMMSMYDFDLLDHLDAWSIEFHSPMVTEHELNKAKPYVIKNIQDHWPSIEVPQFSQEMMESNNLLGDELERLFNLIEDEEPKELEKEFQVTEATRKEIAQELLQREIYTTAKDAMDFLNTMLHLQYDHRESSLLENAKEISRYIRHNKEQFEYDKNTY